MLVPQTAESLVGGEDISRVSVQLIRFGLDLFARSDRRSGSRLLTLVETGFAATLGGRGGVGVQFLAVLTTTFVSGFAGAA